jgi:hypothetical protein
MAYLREEKENIEASFPIKAVWKTIPDAIAKLEWKIEESDETTYHVKVKTKGAFLSYHSILKIDLTEIDEKTTKMTISGETPVTTITAMADYGRTNERIEAFVTTLAKLMEKGK